MPIRVPAHLSALRPYTPGKPMEEVEREMGLSGLAKLASNENPFGPSPRAREAAQAALSESNRYPDASGFYLKRALAERLGVPPDSIVLGNGSTDLVELLARAFVAGGGDAVASEGAFLMYRIAVTAVGAVCRLAPMTKGLGHDLNAMAAAVGAATRLVYIANPNNPTGTYLTQPQLDAFVGRLPEDVLVVVDEAYREYMVAPDYADMLPHVKAGRPVVVLRTFSKAHGLAGLRIGYALTTSPIAAILERVRSPFNTSSVSQAAALAALDDEAHVARSVANNTDQLKALTQGLSVSGIPYTPSVANFLLIHPPADPALVYDDLLRRGIIVRPMAAFGFPASIRVSVGTPGENQRFLRAIDDVLRAQH